MSDICDRMAASLRGRHGERLLTGVTAGSIRTRSAADRIFNHVPQKLIRFTQPILAQKRK